jgi:hypothetical protein
VVFPESKAPPGRAHTDFEYGHAASEINFWVSLNGCSRKNTLWAESVEGREDFRAFELAVGEMKRFRGSRCWHYAKVEEKEGERHYAKVEGDGGGEEKEGEKKEGEKKEGKDGELAAGGSLVGENDLTSAAVNTRLSFDFRVLPIYSDSGAADSFLEASTDQADQEAADKEASDEIMKRRRIKEEVERGYEAAQQLIAKSAAQKLITKSACSGSNSSGMPVPKVSDAPSPAVPPKQTQLIDVADQVRVFQSSPVALNSFFSVLLEEVAGGHADGVEQDVEECVRFRMQHNQHGLFRWTWTDKIRGVKQ